MERFCYCSKVLPQKSDHIKNRNALRKSRQEEENALRKIVGLTRFSSWLQKTAEGDFMIHCLEGASLESMFTRLREQIQLGNPNALGLHAFYLDVLGKDYSLYSAEPQVECLLDMKLPLERKPITAKGFIYPLLPHMEEEHRKFRQESNGEKRGEHVAYLAELGVRRLTSWLQTTPHGKYIVTYTEKEFREKDLCKEGHNSPEWQQIYDCIQEQTGLSKEALTPDLEQLSG